MNKPQTVSVVLANYNHEAYLARAIDSVLGQTRPPDEFLILDDASTDESVAIIESYLQRVPFLRLIRNHQNEGVIAAYRRLFETARCGYVHPMAADDERYPTFLERAMEMAARYPQAGVILGDVVIWDEHDRQIGVVSIGRWREPLFADPKRYLEEYLMTEPPSHSLVSATLFRREPFEEIGWYQAELASFGDTFSLHAVALKHGACYVPERFAVWRNLRKGFSHAALTNPHRALERIREVVGLMRSERFRGLFPESFVRAWERRYVWRVAGEYWRGDHAGDRPADASRVARWQYRLPRTFRALALALCRPKP
jgi:glycosyltransferase involved in cell wall biosynthesis